MLQCSMKSMATFLVPRRFIISLSLWQRASKPNVVEAMDDGDIELLDMAVFEPWAPVRNKLCEWTYSGPSDAHGHSVLRKKELVSLDSVSSFSALPHGHRLRMFRTRWADQKERSKGQQHARGHEQTTGLQTWRRVQALGLLWFWTRCWLAACANTPLESPNRCTRLSSRTVTTRRCHWPCRRWAIRTF